jgi:hypothetical protein
MQGERLPPTQGRHRQQTASSQHPAELAQRGGLVEEVKPVPQAMSATLRAPLCFSAAITSFCAGRYTHC